MFNLFDYVDVIPFIHNGDHSKGAS